MINESIENLNSRNKLLKTKIDQFRTRNEDLEQRMLKVKFNFSFKQPVSVFSLARS